MKNMVPHGNIVNLLGHCTTPGKTHIMYVCIYVRIGNTCVPVYVYVYVYAWLSKMFSRTVAGNVPLADVRTAEQQVVAN